MANVSCNATRVDTLKEKPIAGSFKFGTWYADPDEPPAFLLFCCPCGCGDISALQLRGEFAREVREPTRPTWDWNGDRDAPTLTPSILHYALDEKGNRAGEHWHGHLTAGRFVGC